MANVHFIGIGGTGLSAMARVLLERGESVSGSDRQLSPLARSVEEAGGRVFIGHSAANVSGARLVVRSSAVPDSNVEVQAALQAGIPVLKRSDFLSYLTQGSRVIAVAGTHGKTTTTAMIAWMLTRLGKDPTYVIGSVAANLGKNAHAGQGEIFVIEADEYDHMFLGLKPSIAVVTNIEHDHPDCFPTPADFFSAFTQFAGRIAEDGCLLACAGHPGSLRLANESRQAGRRVLTYGQAQLDQPIRMDFAMTGAAPNPRGGFDFTFVESAHLEQGIRVSLQVPGLHNALNAVAALGVAHLQNLPLAQAANALNEYKGAERRFEVRGEAGGILVIDDYAHHPTEIRVTLAAARARYPQKELWAVWQPHTYSRTRALLHGFAGAFSDAHHVLVTEVYPARESAPDDGFTSRQVIAAMRHPDVRYTPALLDVQTELAKAVQPGSVVLVFSAGDAEQVSARFLDILRNRHSQS